jgi:hypothetical protein
MKPENGYIYLSFIGKQKDQELCRIWECQGSVLIAIAGKVSYYTKNGVIRFKDIKKFYFYEEKIHPKDLVLYTYFPYKSKRFFDILSEPEEK